MQIDFSQWLEKAGLKNVRLPLRGTMENHIAETNSKRLVMAVRSQLGCVFLSRSDDRGENWSHPQATGLSASESMPSLTRIPATGHLLLIWNNAPYDHAYDHSGKRTPLTAAVSSDEGKTWTHKRDLETSAAHTYAYTSLTFVRGRAVLTYYVGDEATGRISSRFRSLPIGWFYEKG